VNARRAPPTVSVAWSSIASRTGLGKDSRNRASISVWVALPRRRGRG